MVQLVRLSTTFATLLGWHRIAAGVSAAIGIGCCWGVRGNNRGRVCACERNLTAYRPRLLYSAYGREKRNNDCDIGIVVIWHEREEALRSTAHSFRDIHIPKLSRATA